MRRDRASRPWHLYLLGLLVVLVAVMAGLEIGPPSSSARTSREIVTAEDGVVQSTVTATGNIAAGTDEDVNFKTSGTLETVYVSTGQHVTRGQLLAQLDPAAAQLTLDQAEENLTAAEDQLSSLQSGGSSSSGSSASGASTTTRDTSPQSSTEFVSNTTPANPTTPPTRRSGSSSSSAAAKSSSGGSSTTSARGATSTTSSTPTTTTPSPSSIASAQASVYGAEASLANAEQGLADTKLYAPVNGTIASMANLVPGDAVAGGSSSNAAGSGSSTGASGTGAGSGTGAASGSGSGASGGSLGASSSSSSSGGSSSSSAFLEIVNTSSLSMTVAFSESDISKVKVGQPATVTFDALPSVELAGHVSTISDVGTTSSGVVSYDATITIDQSAAQVKPGMSASASVITGQAQGVNVPNAAITGSGSLGTVNLMQGGKTVQQQVVVGLRGDSRTQIISGLSAGQQLAVTVTLPALSTSTTSTSGSSGTLGGSGRLGGGGLGGGGGFFGGGGGGAFFRGGGG